jgi:hypothetical protein
MVTLLAYCLLGRTRVIEAAIEGLPEADVRLTANIRRDLHLKPKIDAAQRRANIGGLIEEPMAKHLWQREEARSEKTVTDGDDGAADERWFSVGRAIRRWCCCLPTR